MWLIVRCCCSLLLLLLLSIVAFPSLPLPRAVRLAGSETNGCGGSLDQQPCAAVAVRMGSQRTSMQHTHRYDMHDLTALQHIPSHIRRGCAGGRTANGASLATAAAARAT